MEDTRKKTGPSDGSELEKISENEDEENKEKKIEQEDVNFEKELEEMERKRKEQELERRKEMKRNYDNPQEKKNERDKGKKEEDSGEVEGVEKKDKEEEKKGKDQKLIAGQPIQTKRVFERAKPEGIFRHHKVNNFSGTGIHKMEKALKRVHGVSAEQKIAFIQAVQAYNPTKSTLLKKDLENLSRGLRFKKYVGTKFNRMKKFLDPKTLDFEKREIDKMRRGLTGQADPHKFQRSDTSGFGKQQSSKRSK